VFHYMGVDALSVHPTLPIKEVTGTPCRRIIHRSYMISGLISILRKMISAPSEWKFNLPRLTLFAGRGHEELTSGQSLRLSNALTMELATELTAEILGLGECLLILAADGKDHSLTALKLVGRRDA
jgi:hypothetical protein